MKRSNWVRLIAVILIISMLAAPVSAAPNRGNDGVRTNGVVGIIVDFIRDIIRDIFDDWFDEPGEEEPTPTTPVNPTTPTPTQPGETEPEETDPTEPGETKPTQPGETQPGETEPTEPGETEPEEDEDKPETTMQLIEGYENTENGHLLRGHTYTLSQVIAQQNNKPATTTTANRFGTKLGGGLGGNSASTGLKPMGGLSVMADDAETTISDTALVITYDDNGKALIPDGDYILYSSANLKYMTNTVSWSDWSTNAIYATNNKNTAAVLTFTRQADGTYTVQDSNGMYIHVTGRNSANVSSTPVYMSIEADGNNTVMKDLNTGNEYCYLNALGGSGYSYFGGWSAGSPISLYAVTTAEPEEPEKPEPLAELIYFPVTMFNYNNGTTLLNDDSILRNLTHQAEVKAGLKETWEGLYFSGGTPSSTSYTYSATVDAHTDLTWQQVMNGTYYADEACTNQAVVNEIIEGSGEYEITNVTVGDIWAAFGGDANDTWYPTTYKHRYYGEYRTVAIRRTTGATYYTLGYQAIASRPDLFYHLGDFNTSDVAPLYAVTGSVTGYNLVAGGQTLATLNGTNTNEQIGVTLYTAGGTKTVNKFYAKWNWWSYRTNSEDAVDDQNKFYTGLVQDELVDGEIKFNVVEPGIFTFDSSDPTVTNDGIKDIYQNVGLPFVKNVTREGFYTFDSDAHGTYFKDTNGDGKSDPSYGTSSTDYFEMLFDYEAPQGWPGMWYGDGSSKLWAPYNTNTNDSSEGNIDYHFGMRADIPFSMTPNGCVKSTDDNSDHIEFSFAGDDDVWIFIDGHLVIDLGGIHNRIGATIDFADNTITYKRPTSNINTLPIGSFNNPEKYPLNEDGTITVKLYNDTEGEGALGQTRTDFSAEEEHMMTIFYLERGKGTSNCKIEFNLPMRDTLLITKDATQSWSAKQDATDGTGDGTAPMTTKEQAAADKLDFGFTLFKKNHDETAFTAVKNTNFFVQDKDGKVIATSSTDGNGKFYLKNGQTAKFMTDFPKEGVTYYVVEDAVPEGFLTPDYKYAGVAIDGFEYIGSGMDEDGNKFEMDEAIKVSNASQIPEHELPLDATENKSYEITAYGSIEAIDSLEFKCINYLNADLPSPTAIANEDIIVIDYGLPVQIDPLHNDLFRGEDIEIVAWGDETLTLSEELDEHGFAIDAETTWTDNKVLAAAKVAANNNSYNNALIDLADCLYTFKAVGDGCYEVSATTADGTKVYLNHYTTDTNEIPNDSIPSRIKIENGANQNMFKLIAQVMEGGTGVARTLHFHSEQTVPYWNRCGNDTSFKCQEYLYRPAGKDDVSSTEIPGYVMVTSTDKIVDGGQYLIVHDKDYNSTDDDLFVLHPSTSSNMYDHVAKLETTRVPAIGTSFSFDSGNVTFKDKTYAEYEHEGENEEIYYTYDRDTFEYELTEQLTEVEEINYIIKVTSTVKETVGNEEITKTACRYALGKIYIVPATIMYYEENFSDMITFEGAGWNEDFTVSNQNNVSPFQEPGVVGTIDDSTYGSDVAYLSDNGDSNGTYRFGDTTNKAIRFTYTFTGTGTTIFARTSALTGYMQVKLYCPDENGNIPKDEEGNEILEDLYYRDTYWEDKNGSNLDASGTLYNIPVYTNEDLEYGTYTVVCTVAKMGTLGAGKTQPLMKQTAHECYDENGVKINVPANTKDHRCRDHLGRELEAMQSGNEFYLDGIRVMQPLNEYAENTELTDKALAAYATDGESNLDVVTLRQKLITDAEEGDAIWDGENFVVLTDTNGAIVKASDYKSIGPKEEVYLAPGQKVSFSLKSWKPEGLKLYMGMKAPFGNAKVHVGHDTYELKNAPDCYYDVTDNYESLVTETDEDGNKYYVVTYTFEAAESIVSLTNIKVVGQYEFTIVEDFDENVDGDSNE